MSREISKIAVVENGNLNLRGTLENKKNVELLLPNMTILQCYFEDEIVSEFAVSKELVDKTHQAFSSKYDTMRFYFYFKNRNDFYEIEDTIYVVAKDLPEELNQYMENV